MKSFPECINEYRKRLENGDIKVAYRGLMDYVMNLKAHFKNKHPIISYLTAFIKDIWI